MLVLDNLNPYPPASLYEAFPPAEARRPTAKLAIPYTPGHGSWLHMAAIELSGLAEQGPDRRPPAQATLTRAVAAWEAARTGAGRTVNRRCITADARIEPKRLDPVLDD